MVAITLLSPLRAILKAPANVWDPLCHSKTTQRCGNRCPRSLPARLAYFKNGLAYFKNRLAYFKNGAKSALLSLRGTGMVSHMRPFENTKSRKVGSSNASAVVFPRSRSPDRLRVDHARSSKGPHTGALSVTPRAQTSAPHCSVSATAMCAISPRNARTVCRPHARKSRA